MRTSQHNLASFVLLLLLAFAPLTPQIVQALSAGQVSTLAGPVAGQDGSLGSATFAAPQGVAYSSDGSFALVADTHEYVIRKISFGIAGRASISTIAGLTGVPGYLDAIGPAARFRSPVGIAIAPNSTYALVVESSDHTIRRIDLATKNVITIAGNPGAPGSQDGLGGLAQFNTPNSIAISPNGAFALVSDGGNATIRRIDTATGDVTTIAGLATNIGGADGVGALARFVLPAGIVINASSGQAWVADLFGSTIRTINLTTLAVTTIAGQFQNPGYQNGNGTATRFAYPTGVALNPAGTALYITDNGNAVVRKLVIAGATVTTIAGTVQVSGFADGLLTVGQVSQGGAFGANSSGVAALAVHPTTGALLLADTGNDSLRSVNPSTTQLTTLAGRPMLPANINGIGALARFNLPAGVALSPDGSFALVADTNNHTIRKIIVSTGQVTTFAGIPGVPGSQDGGPISAQFSSPSSIAISPDASFALVADTNNHTIRKIMISSGEVTTIAGSANSSGTADSPNSRLKLPAAVAISPDGSFALVADTGNHTIRRLSNLSAASATVTTIAGNAGIVGSKDSTGIGALFNGPSGVAISPDGSFAAIADTENHTIRILDLLSFQVDTLAGSPTLSGATNGNGGAARFNKPHGLAVNLDQQAILVVDTNNHAIRAVSLISAGAVLRGDVTTLAGGMTSPGDNDGAALAARFYRPTALALSSNGATALLADTGNSAIRLITLSGITPQISSLNPPTAPAGAAFTLTISGIGFVPGALVQWGAATLVPQSLSPTQISVLIPANLLSGSGTVSVTVVNPAPSSGVSNALLHTVTPAIPIGSTQSQAYLPLVSR